MFAPLKSAHGTSNLPAPETTMAVAAADGLLDGEDDEEDLAIVCSICENFHLHKALPTSSLLHSSLCQICLWPPSDTEDDDKDDLEMLRAMQCHFVHNHSGCRSCAQDHPQHPEMWEDRIVIETSVTTYMVQGQVLMESPRMNGRGGC